MLLSQKILLSNITGIMEKGNQGNGKQILKRREDLSQQEQDLLHEGLGKAVKKSVFLGRKNEL
jgi:hypothetical protein